MGDHAHRPVLRPAARWFQPFSIARPSGPSITTYTPMVKVQAIKSTIYEMACGNKAPGKIVRLGLPDRLLYATIYRLVDNPVERLYLICKVLQGWLALLLILGLLPCGANTRFVRNLSRLRFQVHKGSLIEVEHSHHQHWQLPNTI